MMYSLRLSDNQFWGIEAAEDAQDWADEFARLLGLESSQERPDRTICLERLPVAGDAENGCPRTPPYDCPGEAWQVRILRSLELWRAPGAGDVLCRLGRTTDARQVKQQMKQALLPIYESTVCWGGLPLHAGLAEFDGKGILLVGRSGVGKSTTCRRLPPGWNVLGDDLALAVRSPWGGFSVHPLPTWSAVRIGSREHRWNIQQSAGLSAIFFLAQAGEDEVIPASKAMASVILDDAAMTIFHSLQLRRSPSGSLPLFRNVFSNAVALAHSVPTYVLRLSLAGRFWEKIEKSLADQKANSGPVKQKNRISHVAR